ncbi:MAG: Fe-S cluster assembly protein SufD [Prevotellaceae bacterium]|jgi:Fe-S cluster assembly protein SufD|nr:Fe-S cluster assembly protein SufD [Prevotellaceae bacterium]
MNLESSYVDLYMANMDLLREGVSDIINKHRSDAIESFNLLGIPTKKVEKYKYTNLAERFAEDFEKYFTPKHEAVDLPSLFTCDVPDFDTYKVYILNGFYYGDKKLLEENGVVFGSLAEASFKYLELFEKYYNTLADNQTEGVTALNTAFAQDGVFIYAPKSATLNKPIQIINFLLSEEDTFVQTRNLFVFEENSNVRVIICDHTLSAKRFLTNAVTEVYVAPEANIELVRMQNEHNLSTHVTSDYVQQNEKSVFISNTITLHGGMVRNNINVVLNGEYCENHTYGLFLSDKIQHVDNYANIDHAVPNCVSNELFKGVLDDKSTGAFNGGIMVRRDAQKTQAYQASNNLLLTGEARVYAKPQLEIYADDVKCSHGATVGQLDAEALFYMQSRGIGKRKAQLLQLYGFAYDVVQKVGIEALRESVAELVRKRLRGELARCENCSINCG